MAAITFTELCPSPLFLQGVIGYLSKWWIDLYSINPAPTFGEIKRIKKLSMELKIEPCQT
ncbi:hypothetical protein ACN9M1_14095 [Ralstonia sp. R-29]|uniref:hypothetical protein n=1 Tax=Ralstonia sp. R-29 TaxID=3404059 RepID=UPI003CEF155D